jgi:hypothetical protein
MLLLTAFAVNSLITLLVFLLHYEVLFQLGRGLPRVRNIAPRFRVLFGVGIIFLAHVIEIWIYGAGYYALLQFPDMGKLVGELSGHGLLLDCVYLSFVTFTTVGYGELVAEGYIRYLTGIEALAGLILITWSASFLFIEMQKYWTLNNSRKS